MYITSLTVSQVGQASGHVATLLVRWVYGNQAVDVMQISVGGVSQPAPSVTNVPVTNKSPTKQLVHAPAGAQLSVGCFPRLTKAGTFLDQMPDESGQEKDFQSFALSQIIVTVDQSSPAPPPRITKAESFSARLQEPNHISISWEAGNYSSYRVRSAKKGTNEREDSTTDTNFTLPRTQPNQIYTFRVKGIGLSTNPSSEFSPITEVVAKGNNDRLRQFLADSGIDLRNTVSIKTVFPSVFSLRRLMELE